MIDPPKLTTPPSSPTITSAGSAPCLSNMVVPKTDLYRSFGININDHRTTLGECKDLTVTNGNPLRSNKACFQDPSELTPWILLPIEREG